ncbi:MAG: sulfur oxidation c-type cytochrome SoxX [Pseudomonadota bacterium]|nr:sulfur oxidation c-type cytochrome SoxX [Pseudomonadota bacterium]
MHHKSLISILGAATLAMAGGGFSATASAESWPSEKECKDVKDPSNVIKGWCAAIDRTKGNCLSCHNLYVTPWPEGFPEAGNIAPTLVKMQIRFPDKAVLRAQVWDAAKANPKTVMPPFGKHKLLSEEEIDNVLEFLYSI